MGAKTGYVLTAFGTALSFGGTMQIVMRLGATEQILAWGLLTILGLFVLARGISLVLSTADSEDAANPKQAIGKTDSRFGRR
jgi:hypothetical protein